jgi:D-sedoheptulose 7-phosphate isomerase
MQNRMRFIVRSQLAQSIATLQAVLADDRITETIVQVSELTADAMKNGHKLMVAGNGGSAADSQHLVAEFVSRLTIDRPALRAIALTVDSSILTAIGNDFSYDNVFERQVEALGQAGDVLLGISTSGNSPNLIKALKYARAIGIITIGLTGKDGGKMRDLCDHNLIVPSGVTMNIQESHLALEHILCMLVERFYFGDEFDCWPQEISE